MKKYVLFKPMHKTRVTINEIALSFPY